MKTKIQTPEIKVSFQEGKDRIKEMIDDMYNDIIKDGQVEIYEEDVKRDKTEIFNCARTLIHHITEYNDLISKVDECDDLFSIVNLSTEFAIFEGCEEILVGAFLGTNITIVP